MLVGSTIKKKWNKIKNKIMKPEEKNDLTEPQWQTLLDTKNARIYTLDVPLKSLDSE